MPRRSIRTPLAAWLTLAALVAVAPACRQAQEPPADIETAAAPPAAEAPPLEQVTASSLNVRSGPGTEHGVVGRLARGALVRVLETSGGWKRIRPDAGELEGWVAGDYVQAAPSH